MKKVVFSRLNNSNVVVCSYCVGASAYEMNMRDLFLFYRVRIRG